jgi:subtilisin family serine protease
MPFPVALYFVTTDEFKKLHAIRLISPEKNANIEFSPVVFSWEKIDATSTYLIEFMPENGERPVFSAYTKELSYKIPLKALSRIFERGKKYQWRVKGFDFENNIVAESDYSDFSFSSLASYLPGQIMVALNDNKESQKLADNIRDKYKLTSVELYDLKSINMKVFIFKTEEDIFRIIDEIKGENPEFIAQPNIIFRSSSDPLCNMQNTYKMLNIPKIQQKYTGKGVNVAVIDTGVDINHKDLQGIIKENFINNESYKPEIHGTAVAGIIASNINRFGIEGIAPDTKIIALRACRQITANDPLGECYSSTISKAIDVAIEKNVKLVNMSLGAQMQDPIMARLIEEGVKKGMIFVAPVGNTYTQSDIAFPASHKSVISVGGFDDKGGFFPNEKVSSKAKVCAPSSNIFTTIPDNKHNFLNGTSLSSAVISGILALSVEKNNALNMENLPKYEGNLCKWLEQILEVKVCEK